MATTLLRNAGLRLRRLLLAAALLIAVARAVGRSASEIHATSLALDLLPARGSTAPTRAAPAQPPQATQLSPPPSLPQPPEVFLVIGVKTRVRRGVEARAAIRETWAARPLTDPLGVRVVFLGCTPDLSTLTDADKVLAQEAITAEKAEHQDLWTDELQCVDSFFTLVGKTMAFLHRAVSIFPTLAYVMVADDDVYVRLDRLVEMLRSDRIPNKRFYGGNVASTKFRTPQPPVRHPESRYYLPTSAYPLSQLPPFPAGTHYVLSKDLVEFLVRSRGHLRGLRGLDDVTMALWMLTLRGLSPVFLPEFQIVRAWDCTASLVSYGDLAPSALRVVHSNVVANRDFCADFDRRVWFKQYSTVTFAEFDPESETTEVGEGDVTFMWDTELDPVSSRLRIHALISIANETVDLMYAPSEATYALGFCNRVLPLLESKLSILVGTNFCRMHRNLLLAFLKDHDTTLPSLRPLLTLARHNLERDALDDEANTTRSVVHVWVAAAKSYRFVHVLVECLMVAVYPEQHIVVLDDTESLDTTPNVVVVVIDPAASTVSVQETVAKFLHRFDNPELNLMLLAADGRSLEIGATDPRIVVISSDFTTGHPRHVYLPQVSTVFAGVLRHSPLALLRAASDDTSTTPPRSFCRATLKACDLTYSIELFQFLSQNGHANTLSSCEEISSSYSSTTHSQTPTDDTIDFYRRYRFVVIGEHEQRVPPGFVSQDIALAFLAGSIPVVFGHSDTVRHLFNPAAFIDCNRFETPQDCAQRLAEVHYSPLLYDRMRSEPPVANASAFVDLFSWHPDIVALKPQRSVGHRLAGLLHST